ncbi:UDP-glucose dehydrogenase family protein [Paenibacillus chartarius]|uniref:UDP-glucose 6-dehydrogenase n=1 Tax=Paenibacillus chartarius TaxID=747481 RepID=A0ABV6DMU0_9BACL
MKIGIIGTGYVGLVTGVCLAEMGHEVTCIDQNTAKIQLLQSGQAPIYEPGLEPLLTRHSALGTLQFRSSIAEMAEDAAAIFIAVGTPSGADGTADLSFVLQAADQIADFITRYTVVVAKSTVPVGTTRVIMERIQAKLESRGLSRKLADVVSNPEFLREGKAIEDFLQPDRIVVGIESQQAARVMEQIYEPLTKKGHSLIVMDLRSSEMTKYAANAMLASRISFINEIAELCEATGADVEKVRLGIGSDHRIGPFFLSAGVGYGGSCFPKDVAALMATAREYQASSSILQATVEVNRRQRKRFLAKVAEYFHGSLEGKAITVWGVAFKPDTDDIREAPALDLIKSLLNEGAAVSIHDPIALPHAKQVFGDRPGIRYFNDPYEAVQGAHALMLVTDWDVYRKADMDLVKKSMNKPVVFDGRNVFDPVQMKNAGFHHYSIGRKASWEHE